MAQDKDLKTPNVPPLRFPGFTDDWVEMTIQNLATVLGGGTPDTTNKSYWNGNIQWFTPSEIGKNKYVNTSLRTITEDGLNNSSAKLLPPYTILLSSRATVGECSLTLQECATNQGFQSLIAKNCDTDFLYYLIQTKKKELIKKSCGSTFLEISANEVRKIKVAIPTKDEQLKISHMLSLIDERIATQNKIIDNLQSLIKGLREAVFKREYLKYVNLGEIAKLYQPQTISTSELEDSGFLVYGANGVIGRYHSYNHEEPQICITCRGNTCGQVTLTSPFSWITGNAMVVNIENNPGINQSFLFHFLSFYNYAPIISGSGQPQIVRTPLERIKVPNLSLYEQSQISNILDTIMQKIDMEQNIFNCFQLQKTYLLNIIFI